MDMYKQASKEQLRVQTSKGLLSVEQLWDLSVTELDKTAVALQAAYEESGKKSFLVKRSVKDKVAKLKFDVVLDILQTKVEEEAAEREKVENKAHNAKIDALIAEKEDEELKKLSAAKLKSLRR